MISIKARLFVFAGLLFLCVGQAYAATQLTGCAAGVTNCPNDTTNDAGVLVATQDINVQGRIWFLFNIQCAGIYGEISPVGQAHAYRVGFCQSIAAGRVPRDTLVAAILNATTTGQIIAGQGPSPYTPVAGNLVDADVNTAIGAALTVTVSGGTSASTTATQATVGASNISVASASGIITGMAVYAAGVPAGTVVIYVTGTTVYLSGVTTTALSSTPIAFVAPTIYGGLAARAW